MEYANDACKDEFMYMYVNSVLIDIHVHCKERGADHGLMNTSTVDQFLNMLTPFIDVFYDKDADFE